MRRWAVRVAERREEQFVIGKAAAAGGRRRARRGAEVPGPGELPGSQPSPAPREGEEKCGWREPLSRPPFPRLVGRAARARLPRERFNGRVRPRRGAERAGGLLLLEAVAAQLYARPFPPPHTRSRSNGAPRQPGPCRGSPPPRCLPAPAAPAGS